MGILTRLYDRLAADGRLDTLMCLGMLDERVYEVVERHKLVPAIVDTLPSPLSAAFLARGMCYDCIGDEVIRNFIPICMMLSRYRSVAEGATLAELIGNCGLPEHHRMHMFNFSETYRHMILSESYFPQRAVLRLLSYVFCDDVLSDAVAQLQYKSDILNHINKVYVTTPDFVSWRFSVRCMSLAGGFNEDRSDVDETERLTQLVTRMLPEFALYFVPALVYARFRHYPRRVRGIVPRWLAYQRALFSASCTGVLGLYSNSLLEYRLQRHRALYELRCSQEQRRRGGALRRSTHYEPNVYFDNLVGVTQRVYAMQLTAYTCTAAALCCSLLPLASVTFPRWMGDVAWRHPFLPRLFPALFGMHTASRCLVPFVLAPFTIVSLVRWQNWGTTVYDGYVELRHRLWHRRAQLAYESVTDGVDADVTK